MHADAADTGLSAASVETAVDRPCLDRPTGASREYQPVIWPGTALLGQPSAHAVMSLTLDLERRQADAGHRQHVAAAACRDIRS